MKRKATIFDCSATYGSSYRRFLCVDVDNQEAIFSLIEKKIKKFKYIVERTLTRPNLYWDCYDKEVVNSRTIDTSAIKFFDVDNARIYCKEKIGDNGEFYIVCAEVLLRKKVQKNNTQIIRILETISKYEYEIVN